MQTALGKLEVERDDWVREVKEVTSERNLMEQKLTEMDDMLRYSAWCILFAKGLLLPLFLKQ